MLKLDLRSYPCALVRVVDGDTIEALIDLGFGVKLRKLVRLDGIDACEVHSPDPEKRAKAEKARDWLALKLARHAFQGIHLEVDGKQEFEKYGRVLAEVWGEGEKDSVNHQMIELGLAAPYSGGKR